MLDIYKGTTSATCTIPADREVVVELQQFLKQYTREWIFNPRNNRWMVSYEFFRYNDKLKQVLIPVGFVPKLIEHFEKLSIPCNAQLMDPILPRAITLQMKSHYLPRDHQKEPIAALSNSHPGMCALPMQTGEGKTFVSIAAMLQLGYASLIVTSGLVEQWVTKLMEYTGISEALHVIKGFDSIAALLESNVTPDVIVCSLETLRLYALQRNNYDCLPMSYSEFLVKYGIGTKIMDEVHEKYHSLVMIDLMSNVRHNIYLSATFGRNDKNSQRIFETIYPKEIMVETARYNRHVSVFMYGYNGNVQERKVVRQRGYMHAKYEKEIFTREYKMKHFVHIVKTALEIHYFNIRHKGDRALLFFATNVMVDMMAERLSAEFPHCKIVKFYKDDKDEVYEDPEVEIIISTLQKSGTGKDIPNLLTVINTVSTQAKTKVEQMLGRLRKYRDKGVPQFVDLFDQGMNATIRHMFERKEVLFPRAYKFERNRLE